MCLGELAPPVVWPNRSAADLSPARPRLEVALAAVDPTPLTYQGRHLRRWIYQITVVTDAREGQYEALALADALVERFAFGETLGVSERRLYVYQRPTIGPGLEEHTEWRLPVQVPVESITP